MEAAKFINKNGVSLNVTLILSFETEKEFLKDAEGKYFKRLDPKERKRLLKEMYKEAKDA